MFFPTGNIEYGCCRSFDGYFFVGHNFEFTKLSDAKARLTGSPSTFGHGSSCIMLVSDESFDPQT